jgi:hypothetical protein
MSLVMAEANHLRPDNRQRPRSSWRATVSLPPTSEPPLVSVIHWPLIQSCFGSRLSKRGTARSISALLSLSCSTLSAPSVIASGHENSSLDGWKR